MVHCLLRCAVRPNDTDPHDLINYKEILSELSSASSMRKLSLHTTLLASGIL